MLDLFVHYNNFKVNDQLRAEYLTRRIALYDIHRMRWSFSQRFFEKNAKRKKVTRTGIEPAALNLRYSALTTELPRDSGRPSVVVTFALLILYDVIDGINEGWFLPTTIYTNVY